MPKGISLPLPDISPIGVTTTADNKRAQAGRSLKSHRSRVSDPGYHRFWSTFSMNHPMIGAPFDVWLGILLRLLVIPKRGAPPDVQYSIPCAGQSVNVPYFFMPIIGL